MSGDEDQDFNEMDIEEQEEINEQEVQALVHSLKTRLKDNPFEYECHVELIKNLKLLNDMEELETSRKLFSSLFPLSADIWLDWIGDVKLMISGPEEKKALIDMYLLAVKDYQDIAIWKSLFEYLLEECSDEDDQWLDLKEVRRINRLALKSMRRHYTESHIIFRSAMELEMLFLEKSPKENEHVEFVRSQYLEMLAAPHEGIDETFSAYSAFESANDSGSYDFRMKSGTKIVSKTKSLSNQRDMCEADLRTTEHALQSFQNYIASVKKWKYKQKQVADQSFEEEMKAIYERAIKIYFWDSSLWISYLSFLSSVQPELIDRVELASVSARAVMSSFACMSNPDLWSLHLIIQESAGKSWAELEESFTRGLSFILASGDVEKMTVLLVFFSAVAGRMLTDQTALLEVFEVLENYQKGVQNVVVSPILQTTMARIVAAKFKDEEAADKIFSNIRHDCRSFIAWATTMTEFENYEKVRRIYTQAVKRPLNNSEQLYQSWIDFEMVHGSHLEVERCLAAVLLAREKDAIHAAKKKPAAELDPSQALVVGDSLDVEAEETDGNGMSQKKRVREESQNAESLDPKRLKKEENKKIGDISSYKVIPNADAGNMVFLGNLPGSVSQESILPIVSKYGKIVDLLIYPNAESGELEALVEFQSAEIVRKFVLDGTFKIGDQDIVPERCRPQQIEWSYSGEEVQDTIYVSNLTSHVNKIELRELFGQFGKIKEIRFPKTHGQKSYSYAYVQFVNKESASQSLTLNNHEYRAGWKIGVAISNPQKKTIHAVDKKRLFVSNLADSIVEEDLKVFFSECGKIDSLRLLKDENGNSKCVAHLSFNTEAEAAKGLELNGTRLDNKIIVVTIADPNKKKSFANKRVEKSSTNTGKPDSRPVKPLPRSTAPAPKLFAPRSTVARKNPKSLVSVPSKSAPASDTKSPAPLSGGKTQDDFRKMLLTRNLRLAKFAPKSNSAFMTTTESKENQQVEMPNVPVIKSIKDQATEVPVPAAAPEVAKVPTEAAADEEEEAEAEGDEEASPAAEVVSLEDATELFAQGTQALALSNFEEAAEKLSIAVEAQVNHFGQYAIEVAPAFYMYGKALLSAAVLKNGVLGEKADQVKPLPTAAAASGSTETAVASEDSKFVFEGDAEEDEDLEEDEGQVLDDIVVEQADDLELAWENLDLARLIYSQQEGKEYVLQLAEVHLSLGDVSLESENFDEAIKDYQLALNLKLEKATPERYRELAEAHFKLALAFEYSEQNEEAIDQITAAMNVLQGKLDILEAVLSGKGKRVATESSETDSGEIKMLKGFLSDLGAKRNDLEALLEKEDQGELVSAAPVVKADVATKVLDISGLVKKRKAVEPTAAEISVPETEKKVKLDEEESNPLLETINKRLRTQKKRLTKIEKYESLEKSQLNADQIETISRKAEVNGNIKELEGILEQVLQLEKLAISEEAEKKKVLEQEKASLVAEAVEQERSRQHDFQRFVQKMTHTLNIPLSSLVGAHSITEDEFSALVKIKQMLVGPFGEDSVLEDFISSSSKLLWNLFGSGSEVVPETQLSYALVNELIDRLLSPQPEPKFGMFSRAAENSKSPAALVTANSSAVIMPAFPSSINFLNPSLVSAGPLEKVPGDSSERVQEVSPKESGEKSKKKRHRRPRSKPSPPAASAPAAAAQ